MWTLCVCLCGYTQLSQVVVVGGQHVVPQVTGDIKHGHQQLFSELTGSPLALSPKVARCSLIPLCANSRGFFFSLSRSFPAGLLVSTWDQGAAPQGGGGDALSHL